jgi:hypothetical protein
MLCACLFLLTAYVENLQFILELKINIPKNLEWFKWILLVTRNEVSRCAKV